MARTKVLIAVKTYPTISTKYEELVCTAGFLESGEWIRIYPVQYRKKAYGEQYKKYQWVEIDLVKNTSDFRPESYRPFSHDSEIIILDEIKPDGNSWDERRKIVLRNVYGDLTQLVADAKDKTRHTSLAVFKPDAIMDLKIEQCEREWSSDKLASLQQLSIFERADAGKAQVVRKLPYKFCYIFKDCNGRDAKLMIEDWEIGQLYWHCLARNEGDESRACQQVKEKYLNDFAQTKDLHLYLGTSQSYHHLAANPFMIIGTFHPKHVTIKPQLTLF